jgi:hypothetical protein
VFNGFLFWVLNALYSHFWFFFQFLVCQMRQEEGFKICQKNRNNRTLHLDPVVPQALKCLVTSRSTLWIFIAYQKSSIKNNGCKFRELMNSRRWKMDEKSCEGTSYDLPLGPIFGPEWINSHQCASWPFCPLDGLHFFIRRRMGLITVDFFLLLTTVLFFSFFFFGS